MDTLRVKTGVGLDGFHWQVFKLPPKLPYHVDVMIDPKGMLVGWVRTRNKSLISEAVVCHEAVDKSECVNLLMDGIWKGAYPSRLAAAECVASVVKMERT